jgi:hypothetical protein
MTEIKIQRRKLCIPYNTKIDACSSGYGTGVGSP